jgi:hypothetical protein
MAHLTASSSLKRPCPDGEASTSDLSTCNASSTKRQCKSLAAKVPSTSLRLLTPGKDIPLKPSSKTMPSSSLRLLIPGPDIQLTPPSKTWPPSGPRLLIPGKDIPPTPSSSVAAVTTMALKLAIPQEQLTRDELAKLNRHKSDAERWKPKLQRPYPNNTEIKRAYPLKLLRHYPDSTTQPEPDFLRPKIDKSPRVSRLLQQFPLLETKKQPLTTIYPTPSPVTPMTRAIPLSARMEDLERAEQTNTELQWNKYITETDHAQQLAWLSFSLPEQNRIDRGRECMIHSGLDEGDLQLELQGWQNGLPEWKKPWTGRFANGVAGWPQTQM